MYNEKIEELINAALVDGVLTDKERKILIRRALQEGVPLDEFEMVLDARVIAARKEREARMANNAPVSNRLGDVRKCPHCGAALGTFQMVCPQCGYEFSNVGVNDYVRRFSAGLEEVAQNIANRPKSAVSLLIDNGRMEERRREEELVKAEVRYVRNYPLPMTKEDCIEALNFILPKIALVGSNGTTLTWRNKYKAILRKMEIDASGNKEILELVAAYRKSGHASGFAVLVIWFKSLSQTARTLIGMLIFYAVFFSLFIPFLMHVEKM